MKLLPSLYNERKAKDDVGQGIAMQWVVLISHGVELKYIQKIDSANNWVWLPVNAELPSFSGNAYSRPEDQGYVAQNRQKHGNKEPQIEDEDFVFEIFVSIVYPAPKLDTKHEIRWEQSTGWGTYWCWQKKIDSSLMSSHEQDQYTKDVECPKNPDSHPSHEKRTKLHAPPQRKGSVNSNGLCNQLLPGKYSIRHMEHLPYWWVLLLFPRPLRQSLMRECFSIWNRWVLAESLT